MARAESRAALLPPSALDMACEYRGLPRGGLFMLTLGGWLGGHVAGTSAVGCWSRRGWSSSDRQWDSISHGPPRAASTLTPQPDVMAGVLIHQLDADPSTASTPVTLFTQCSATPAQMDPVRSRSAARIRPIEAMKLALISNWLMAPGLSRWTAPHRPLVVSAAG